LLDEIPYIIDSGYSDLRLWTIVRQGGGKYVLERSRLYAVSIMQ